MREYVGRSLAVLVAALCICGPAAAEEAFKWRGSGGWGAGLPYGQLYEAGKEQLLEGEVAAVEKVVPLAGMAEGVRLRIRARGETVPVDLGPVWFLERQDFPLERGDVVAVTGVRAALEGKAVFLAREVRKGEKVLSLREGNGFPRWSGWKRQ